MVRLYVATDDGLAVVSQSSTGSGWQAEWPLAGKQAHCVAADPHRVGHLYCGTFDAGLWRSQDAGRSWEPTGAGGAGEAGNWSGGKGIAHRSVIAVAASPAGTVWAGTEPSAIYRSDDGGGSWREQPGLRDLPSAPTWSFPPRPYTSHVRWIQLDPHAPERVLASIEAGGVMRSEDGGETWLDRQRDTPRDAHGLAMHAGVPARVHAASGDVAYAESSDGGRSWTRQNEGLAYGYLWAVLVDPRNPDSVVVSASPGAYHAHRPEGAESAVFRREGSGPWQRVSARLPPAAGTMTYALAASGDALYAAPHQGDVYRSGNGGRSWEALHVSWAQPDQPNGSPYVHALLALD